MKRLTAILFWSALLAAPVIAQTNPIIGASREEVVGFYGPPKNELKSPSREVMNYANGRVIIEAGKVVDSTLPQLAGMDGFIPASQRLPAPSAIKSSVATPLPAPALAVRAAEPIDIDWERVRLIGLCLAVPAAIAVFLFWRKRVRAKIPTVQSYRASTDFAEPLKPISTRPPIRTRPPMMTQRPVPPVVPGSHGSASELNGSMRGGDLLLTERLLSRLEWHRVEILVSRLLEREGHLAQRKHVTDDGSVDLELFERGSDKPSARVRCKGWQKQKIGTKLVREFGEDLDRAGIAMGRIVSTGEFAADARELGEVKKIELISATDLVARVNAFSAEERGALLEELTSGDYTTPTCIRCDVKMVLGSGGGKPLWTCRNHPICRATLAVRASTDAANIG